MPKQKDKKDKKDKSPKVQLTEWQQRNIDFLKRKREREAEQRRQEQEAKEAAKAGLKSLEQLDSTEEIAEPETVKTPKKEPRIPTKDKLKVLPIVLLSLVLLVVSTFLLTPYSKQKQISVSGLVNANEKQIKEASLIADKDYLITVWFNRAKHAQNVIEGNDWVKTAKVSYQFPNRFTIAVDEYEIVAYTDTEDGYRPILENGTRPKSQIVNQLPKNYMAINLSDEKKIQRIIAQLGTIDQKIVKNIDSIDPIEKSVTSDFLLLWMKDGHQIRVPLSKLSERLPYYSQIKPKLTEPSIVDMEVGIYTTTENLEAILAQNRLTKDKPSEDGADMSPEEVVEEGEERTE